MKCIRCGKPIVKLEFPKKVVVNELETIEATHRCSDDACHSLFRVVPPVEPAAVQSPATWRKAK